MHHIVIIGLAPPSYCHLKVPPGFFIVPFQTTVLQVLNEKGCVPVGVTAGFLFRRILRTRLPVPNPQYAGQLPE